MNEQLQRDYDALRTEADLQRLVDEAREEDLHLEFKQKVTAGSAELAPGDKAAFSKALSGFANADGGILIFGIRTEKGTDVDHAVERKPITDAAGFRMRLVDSVSQSTQFSVDGVQVHVIPSTGNTGYVKCLIPASDKAPHRAMLANREYWRRTTNGFQRMEHYELEDAFGRRLRPVLLLALEFGANAGSDEITFSFLNVGRGVARYPGFVCSFVSESRSTVAHTTENIHRAVVAPSFPTVSYQQNVGVIHPNGFYVALGSVTLTRPMTGEAMVLDLTIYAEDMLTKRITTGRIVPGDRLEV